jgi:Adenylate and Guanylate cyclase catalytic domain
LCMRFGLHSGPVTAGVLRGEKGRFQLFGDTVNTEARMESNGARNRIHVSQETATLLEAAGKSSWIIPRDDKIEVKGKTGALQTYWLEFGKRSNPSTSSTVTSDNIASTDTGSGDNDEIWIQATLGLTQQRSSRKNLVDLGDKVNRLVDWNTDVLCRFVKPIILYNERQAGHRTEQDATEYVVDPVVMEQIRSFTQTIASMHQQSNRAFHNFERVRTMSTQSRLTVSVCHVPPNGLTFHSRANLSIAFVLVCARRLPT